MALALKFRSIKVEYFEDAVRNDPGWAALAAKFQISAPPEIDRLYPKLRPARVTVTTARGNFMRQADEALGSRLVPLDDAGLRAKFHRSGRAGARRRSGDTSSTSRCGRSPRPATCRRWWSRWRSSVHAYLGNSASALLRSIAARRASGKKPELVGLHSLGDHARIGEGIVGAEHDALRPRHAIERAEGLLARCERVVVPEMRKALRTPARATAAAAACRSSAIPTAARQNKARARRHGAE